MLSAGGANFWVAAERLKSARLLYPDATIAPAIDDYDRSPTSDQEMAATETLRGWLESSGPQTQSSLSLRFALPGDVMEAALLRLEAEGQILRGRFTAARRTSGSEIEWCNRRVLARIHRLTLGRLRREIEPVNARDFMRFLYHWQHVKPGTQLHGPDGALQVIKQLQGYEISAAAWEGDVLRRRLGKYAPELLDQLCISGEVVWGRLSPHPAFDDQEQREEQQHPAGASDAVGAGRAVPAARMHRGCSRLRPARASANGQSSDREQGLSGAARQVLESLSRRGASFLADVVDDTRQLTSVVEDGLWELAAAGLVTADGFENLRALIDPKRRLATARHPSRRPRFVPGRWALLRSPSGLTRPYGHGGQTTQTCRRRRSRRWRGSYCCAGASFSAIWWRARRSRRHGATC